MTGGRKLSSARKTPPASKAPSPQAGGANPAETLFPIEPGLHANGTNKPVCSVGSDTGRGGPTRGLPPCGEMAAARGVLEGGRRPGSGNDTPLVADKPRRGGGQSNGIVHHPHEGQSPKQYLDSITGPRGPETHRQPHPPERTPLGRQAPQAGGEPFHVHQESPHRCSLGTTAC